MWKGSLLSSRCPPAGHPALLACFLICRQGLGFNIVGGTDQQYVSNDSSIYVSRIKKDGAAYLDGRLQEGDKILAVNGRDLKDLQHKDAVELFRNAGCDVSLKIQRRLYLVGGSFGLREFAQIRYDVHKLHGKVVEMVFFTFPFNFILRTYCLLKDC
uniref:Synaptojanin-2-binding protein n=1 Tax=Strix occidentalis caurina TaxID=311401 RepID=A0A8D0KX12_STROC